MMALAILSVGIVMIYKSFFVSISTLNHVVNRLYASHLIEMKIAELEQAYRHDQNATFNRGHEVLRTTVDRRAIEFNYSINVFSVESLPGLQEVDINLSWKEGSRQITITRSAFISSFTSITIPS